MTPGRADAADAPRHSGPPGPLPFFSPPSGEDRFQSPPWAGAPAQTAAPGGVVVDISIIDIFVISVMIGIPLLLIINIITVLLLLLLIVFLLLIIIIVRRGAVLEGASEPPGTGERNTQFLARWSRNPRPQPQTFGK